jgi:hypothetical protein
MADRARDLQKDLFRDEITPCLKPKGFRRTSQTYYKWVAANCEVVNFQGSWNSTRETYIFYVNLGVFNRRIFEFNKEFGPLRELPAYPKEYECHWRKRLNMLLPYQRSEKWLIRLGDNLAALGGELRTGLEDFAVPLMERSVTDEGLRDLMLREMQEGHLLLPELIDLTALLAEIGPETEFRRILLVCSKDVAKKPYATIAMARIEALRKPVSDNVDERGSDS